MGLPPIQNLKTFFRAFGIVSDKSVGKWLLEQIKGKGQARGQSRKVTEKSAAPKRQSSAYSHHGIHLADTGLKHACLNHYHLYQHFILFSKQNVFKEKTYWIYIQILANY